MDASEPIRDDYQDRCSQIKEEVIQSIKDGTNEGIRQGIETGFLEGIRESADLGFFNLSETICTDFKEFLNAMSSEVVEQKIENRIRERICPVLETRMDRACHNLLSRIRVDKNSQDLTVLNVKEELRLNDLAQDQLNQCIQTINQYIPQNFIFLRLFNGCERALTSCLWKTSTNVKS